MEPATVLGVGINSQLFLSPPDSKPPPSTSPVPASTSPTLTPSSSSTIITVLSSLSSPISLITREEMNQLTSKMSLKSLHNKQINLLSSKTNKDDEFT
ncbi:hypothetical protein F2Q68_00040242 [Brassica cretica]|uniref:Uncharacterized protein n=1 Tax=Brassica cretica TaxID=69181 RepID=A0A8S9MI55_BRACR|nr:hypothetical protein F2Q68_00040242 [Brassica cretica]